MGLERLLENQFVEGAFLYLMLIVFTIFLNFSMTLIRWICHLISGEIENKNAPSEKKYIIPFVKMLGGWWKLLGVCWRLLGACWKVFGVYQRVHWKLLGIHWKCVSSGTFNHSRMSNIESNDSQNGGLEDYNIILMETFHILVPPL